jgi:hypothetical protein
MSEFETVEERARRYGRIDDVLAAIEDALFPVTAEQNAIARRLLTFQDGGKRAPAVPAEPLAEPLGQTLEGPPQSQ